MKFLYNLLAVILIFLDNGGSGVDGVSVSVMEGDSVTLYTGVEMNQQDHMKWYLNYTLFAEITGDLSNICTNEKLRFRDRLKLDRQTGSLTITNITNTTNTDSGVYKVEIISRNNGNTFNVSVNGVSAAERDEVKRKSVKEGESVTLDPGVIRKLNDSMTWHFNEILIAEITEDQSKICTDDQCKERFRDRLKLDNTTGSLNITNTTITDSGLYKSQININNKSNNFSITRLKRFSVSVTCSGLSLGAVAGICAAVAVGGVLVGAGAVYFYFGHHKSQKEASQNVEDQNGMPLRDMGQETPLNPCQPEATNEIDTFIETDTEDN